VNSSRALLTWVSFFLASIFAETNVALCFVLSFSPLSHGYLASKLKCISQGAMIVLSMLCANPGAEFQYANVCLKVCYGVQNKYCRVLVSAIGW